MALLRDNAWLFSETIHGSFERQIHGSLERQYRALVRKYRAYLRDDVKLF